MTNPEFKYWAFISYSHQDEAWARWLHTSLETYRVPRSLVGRQTSLGVVPTRLFPVFRDREELPGAADLGNQIELALSHSRTLVVICSPRSAVSRWVNEEIKTFKAMGRENQIFCLIVDGEPNAADRPDSGLLECFPEALRYRVGADGELTEQRAEPIAADAREGKDGKHHSKLKLLAGILGVGYDELNRREQRRQLWQRVYHCAALFAVLCVLCMGYVALADEGVELWGSSGIRDLLDTHRWSVFRPVYPEASVRAAAERQRDALFQALLSQDRGDGWLARVYRSTKPEDQEVWSHSQAATALFTIPDAVLSSSLRRHLAVLEVPFSSTVPSMAPLPPGKVNGQTIYYGWVPHPYWCYSQAQPALWTAAALAAALSQPGLARGQERSLLLRRLEESQRILETYRPLPFDGGWSTFPARPESQSADSYATVLALQVLLETRDAGVGWNGATATRDRLIQQTADWLVKHYSTGQGQTGDQGRSTGSENSAQVWLPGWSASGKTDERTFEGLTFQIYATLLQAEQEAGYRVPEKILSRMPQHLALCARRDLDFPNDAAEFASVPFTAYHGHKVVGLEQVTFLWYPWAIASTARWLEHATRWGARPLDQTRVQRSYGHLIVDLGDRAVTRDKEAGWTYLAVEHLLGLNAVRLPG